MRKWLMLFAVLFAHPAFGACTLILSTTSGGNWSSTATWTGGVVPGDGNCVGINGPVVINQNIGTTAAGLGWIRVQHSGASLTVSGGPYTIYFGSTGTNNTGSGTSTNPGADATYFGFMVAQGTLNLTASAADPLTVTTASGTNQWYITQSGYDYAVTACSGTTCTGSATSHGGAITLEYDDLINLGTGSGAYGGVAIDWSYNTTPATSLTWEYCNMTSFNQAQFGLNSSHGTTITIEYNYFYGDLNGDTLLSLTSSSAATGWNISYNTEVGATVNGYFFDANNGQPTFTFVGNATESTSTVTRSLFNVYLTTGATGYVIEDNFCYAPANSSLPSNACINWYGQSTDTTSLIENNVTWGGWNGIQMHQGQATVSGNWMLGHSDAASSQGVFIVYGSGTSTLVTANHNVLLLDSDNDNIVEFPFSSTGTGPTGWSTYNYRNETIIGTGASAGISWGEGTNTTAGGIYNGYFRNAIITGGQNAYEDGNASTTWNTSYQYASATMNHILTYGQSSSPYIKFVTSGAYGCTTGNLYWSIGSLNCSGATHPSSTYGDLTVNPRFINSSAAPSNFAAWCGVTNISGLFTNLSYQSTLSGTYNPNCSIANMLQWLRWTDTPMNGLLKNAGYSGDCPDCDIGAVPVYPATAMVIE